MLDNELQRGHKHPLCWKLACFRFGFNKLMKRSHVRGSKIAPKQGAKRSSVVHIGSFRVVDDINLLDFSMLPRAPLWHASCFY